MDNRKIADTELQTVMDGMKETYSRQGIVGPKFQAGHAKFGGRKPGSQNRRTRQAIEICESMNFHPCAFLATIALTGLMPNPDGSTTPVSPDDRIRAATSLAPFVMPRLQAMQLSGRDGGPIETSAVSATILMTPELSEAMQKIAFAAAEAEAKTIDHAPNGMVLE